MVLVGSVEVGDWARSREEVTVGEEGAADKVSGEFGVGLTMGWLRGCKMES